MLEGIVLVGTMVIIFAYDRYFSRAKRTKDRMNHLIGKVEEQYRLANGRRLRMNGNNRHPRTENHSQEMNP